MFKLLIVYDVKSWAYWRRAVALQRYAPADFEVQIASDAEFMRMDNVASFDVVFAIDYMSAPNYRGRVPGQLVASFNRDGTSRQEYWERLLASGVDYTIVNNLHRYIHGGERKRTCCISNGVDVMIHRPTVPIAERPLKALWTGSSNPRKQKGYQEVIEPLRSALELCGWEHSFRPINHVPSPEVYSPEQMVEWYNSGSFILCAAASEGTPNTTLEGMACGCIPITTWVANIMEMGLDGTNCVRCEPTVQSFLDGIEYAVRNRERLSSAARHTLIRGGWDWSVRAGYFYALFRSLAMGRTPSPFTYTEVRPDDIR